MQAEGFTAVEVNGEEYELVAQCTIQTLDDGAPFATVDSMRFGGDPVDKVALVLILGATEAEAAIERCRDSAESIFRLEAIPTEADDGSYAADQERMRRDEEWR